MDAVAVARSLQPLVRSHAEQAERERRLAPSVVSAMAEAGLYRLGVPAAYGGLEADPETQIKTLEAIAEADGSAAWNVMVASEGALALGALAPSVAADLLRGRPGLVVCGAFAPAGRASPAAGGLAVRGRWPFVSGCHSADLFVGGCVLVDDDGGTRRDATGGALLRQVVVPRHSFAVVDTWDSMGLRGTGSHDVVVEDVVVPAELVADLHGTGVQVDGPLYRLPLPLRLSLSKVGVATGIARGALSTFRELAASKRPMGATSLLCERPEAQLAMAEAEAHLRSARAFVFDAVGAMWTAIADREEVGPDEHALVRLACAYGCREAARAVELVHAHAGMSGILPPSTLERAMRDVHVVPQHTWVAPPVMTYAGRALLGLDAGTPMF